MKAKDALILYSVMALWGFNYIIIQLGVNNTDPWVLIAGRFVFAAFPLVFFVKKPDVLWVYLLAYGFFFGTGVWGMATAAIGTGIASGLASVLMKLNVIFTIAAGMFFFKERLTLSRWIGVLIGVCGFTILLLSTEGQINTTGLVYILISTLSWALVGVIVKKAKAKSVFAFSVWGMAFAPIPLICIVLATNGTSYLIDQVVSLNQNAWLSILFQAYPTTILGYWVWNKMLSKYPISMVAPATLLTPVVSCICSYWFFGEVFTQMQIISSVLFVIGVVLMTGMVTIPLTRRKRLKEKAAAS